MPGWGLAVIGGCFTWLVTALGAGCVLFFASPGERLNKICLAFSAGVMTAASIFSLIIPAFEKAQDYGFPALITVTGGIAAGAAFLLVTEKVCEYSPKLTGLSSEQMLFFSVTLHNFPEGLAVGAAFGCAGGNRAALAAAISLTVGIALQNFPEGAAVSLPLRNAGASRGKAFFWGQASALVEPIGALIGGLLAAGADKALPFCLSFAAGAMIWVCVKELIPKACSSQEASGAGSFVAGFLLMMALDTGFG